MNDNLPPLPPCAPDLNRLTPFVSGLGKAILQELIEDMAASPQPQPVQQEPVAWLVTGPFEKRSFDMQSFAESYCKGLNNGFGEDVYKISNLVVQSSEPHEKCNDERMCAACYSGQGKCKTQPVQQEPCPECDGTGTVAGSQAHFPCPLCTSPQAQPHPVQEPVAVVKWQIGGIAVHIVGDVNVGDLLYTSPQAQPLSDADVQQISRALHRHGLTLVRTVQGFGVMKLGEITAYAATKGTT